LATLRKNTEGCQFLLKNSFVGCHDSISFIYFPLSLFFFQGDQKTSHSRSQDQIEREKTLPSQSDQTGPHRHHRLHSQLVPILDLTGGAHQFATWLHQPPRNHRLRAGRLFGLLQFGHESRAVRLPQRQLQKELPEGVHLCQGPGHQRPAAGAREQQLFSTLWQARFRPGVVHIEGPEKGGQGERVQSTQLDAEQPNVNAGNCHTDDRNGWHFEKEFHQQCGAVDDDQQYDLVDFDTATACGGEFAEAACVAHRFVNAKWGKCNK
jgi:hypothetical protein